jgi:hypothetical protein
MHKQCSRIGPLPGFNMSFRCGANRFPAFVNKQVDQWPNRARSQGQQNPGPWVAPMGPCITPHPHQKQTKGDNKVRENLRRAKRLEMRFEDAPIPMTEKCYGGVRARKAVKVTINMMRCISNTLLGLIRPYFSTRMHRKGEEFNYLRGKIHAEFDGNSKKKCIGGRSITFLA